MDDMDMIRLSVPGSLLYRDVVLRVVASTCRLMRNIAMGKQEPSRESHDFDDKVVSAVGEAFNNVAIHAYRGRQPGTVELEFELRSDGITIRLLDTGLGFEPSEERTPNLATLPESHMGLYIVRSFMDQVTYHRGDPPSAPNILTLTKRYVAADHGSP
jgi:serine/threonine-protein kinase RsbW